MPPARRAAMTCCRPPQGDLLRRLGRIAEAVSYGAALELAATDAERRHVADAEAS